MKLKKFKDIKLRNKIILLPVIAIAACMIIILVTWLYNQRNDKLLTLTETGYAPAADICAKLEGELANIQRTLQYAVSAQDAKELENANQFKDSFLTLLATAKSNAVLPKSIINKLEEEFNTYFPLASKTSQLMISGNMNEQVISSMQSMQTLYNNIKEKLTTLTKESTDNMHKALTDSRKNQQKSLTAVLAFTSFAIFFLAIISYLGIVSITRPLKEIMDVAADLAKGKNSEVKYAIDSKDEIGELGEVFSTVIDTNQKLADAAIAIGKGNYDAPIALRSEEDTLGNALTLMKTNLINSSKEIEEKNWLKTGQAELNDRMRGEQDVNTLSQNIVQFLAKYLDAQVGALYLLDDEKSLRLFGSYAYQKRKNISNQYKLGEGLIGQAAMEKQSITLTHVPDDYIKITSGLGECSPRNIMVMPFLYEGEVMGVIELGTYGQFSDLQLKFFDDTVENIGITFNSCLAANKMRELLTKTQQQSEELQSQQEELRQINEELEGQTRSLKESEARLQTQQEELQQTNEELEEKTQELEKQKEDIRKKNTELELAQHELERKARDLELTSKYKSEFLANMSHELRTPLNSLLILSKLLSENKDKNLTKKQVEFSTTIHSSGSDLLNLINEILDLSKVESGKIDIQVEKVDIKQLSEDLNTKFIHMARDKKIDFTTTISELVPAHLFTDQQRLEQIIKNFLSNAFKFTEKGNVSLKIHRPLKSVEFSNARLSTAETIAFSVIDTGKGIAKDKQKLIFEAFQQEDGSTRRKYGGTGLGLSISRELAKLLGGEIILQSDVGKGSTFTLYLPEKLVAHTEAQAKEVSLANDEKSAGKKDDIQAGTIREIVPPPQKIKREFIADDRANVIAGDRTLLIIEDDANFAKILVDLAQKRGFKCIATDNGEDGLEYADEFKPSAIILDIKLPGMDGWAVMEKLKENGPTRHIPVHFMTASQTNIEAMKMGAIGCLTKPIGIETLNDAFQKIEEVISKDIKNLMIVEDDEVQRKSIMELIGNTDVEITAVGKGEEAYRLLTEKKFDCLILDLGLEDISGFDLLEKIKKDKSISAIPVITYTGKELSKKEEMKLKKYSDSIIIKGAKSPERLLEETSLFLHRLEKNLPQDRQGHKKIVHDREAIFQDKKILVVDDDIRNVYALTNILEAKDMEVVIAQNGKEALERLGNSGRIDLVLIDIMMPEMDGYETMKEIRKEPKFRNLPIIAVTAKAMKGDRSKCIEAGANDYLSKPIDMDKLFSLLRVWLYR